jgi:hypothetical protein
VITIKAKESVGMRVMDMKGREPTKDIKRFEGKRSLEKNNPEWENNIKFFDYLRLKLRMSLPL